jgi:uncharacterized protein YndB with AHSA1/START domain
MEPKMITVSASVKAQVSHVWDCWTKPEHIVKWNNASDDWHTTRATNDLRSGGKFTSRMEAKDGSMGFDFEGIYDDVEPMKKIAYTMSDGRKVKILFEGNAGETIVKETFDPENTNSLELQRAGWQSIMNNFKKYTESIR